MAEASTFKMRSKWYQNDVKMSKWHHHSDLEMRPFWYFCQNEVILTSLWYHFDIILISFRHHFQIRCSGHMDLLDWNLWLRFQFRAKLVWISLIRNEIPTQSFWWMYQLLFSCHREYKLKEPSWIMSARKTIVTKSLH